MKNEDSPLEPKKPSKHIILCDYCGTKTIIRDSQVDGLTEVKLADIPGGAPSLDPVTKKIVVKKSFDRTRIFKCKQCGRGVRANKLLVADSQHIVEKAKNEQETLNDGCKTGPAGFPL